MPVKSGSILSIIGVLRIPEESYLYKDKDIGAAGMLLHINGMFTMGKLKLSLLSYNFVLAVNLEVHINV